MPKAKARKEIYIGTYPENWQVECLNGNVILPALTLAQGKGNYPKNRMRVKITLKEILRKKNRKKPKGYWKKYNQKPSRIRYRRKYQKKHYRTAKKKAQPGIRGLRPAREDNSWPASRY